MTALRRNALVMDVSPRRQTGGEDLAMTVPAALHLYMNPAREALTRAVNHAIAEGAPVYVNEPPARYAPIDKQGDVEPFDVNADWEERA